MKLHSLRTIKQSFNFIKKNYLGLFGITIIEIFGVIGTLALGVLLFRFIGWQGPVGTSTNILYFLGSASENFYPVKVLLISFIGLVTLGVILWCIVSVNVSIIQAVILDQKIKFNIFRLARTPEVLKCSCYSLVIYSSLIFMACLAYVVFNNFSVHNVVLIALGAIAFIAVLYVLFGFEIAFNGLAVGEIKSWREFKGAYGYQGAVFKTLLLCTLVYILTQILSMIIPLLLLPLSLIYTIGPAFLYKQRKEKLLEKEAAA